VCHDKGRKLDYRAGYMLPAGWSTLLMQAGLAIKNPPKKPTQKNPQKTPQKTTKKNNKNVFFCGFLFFF
jgi:hypothetical protein